MKSHIDRIMQDLDHCDRIYHHYMVKREDVPRLIKYIKSLENAVKSEGMEERCREDAETG